MNYLCEPSAIATLVPAPLAVEEFQRVEGLTLSDMFCLAYDCWSLLPSVTDIGGQLLFSSVEIPMQRETRRRVVASWTVERIISGPKNRHKLLSVTQFLNRYRLSSGALIRLALTCARQSSQNPDALPNLFCAYGSVFFPVDDLPKWEEQMASQFQQQVHHSGEPI